MTALYSPWGPQNLPARSPKPVIVIAVRCRVQPRNAFRIRIPAKPQAKAAPRQGNSRERFERSNLQRIAVPALSRRGDRHADLNLFGPFKVARYLLSLVQACKQASGCVTQTLKSLSWLVPFHGFNHDGRNVGNVRKAVGEIRNV